MDLVPETVMEKLKQHEQLSITELSDGDKGALKISRGKIVGLLPLVQGLVR